MNICEKMIEMMTARFLSEADARTIMENVIQSPNPALTIMNDRWGESINDYPEMLLGLTWMAVRDEALAYIEEHYPQAFFKPMFFSGEQLEKYKKDHDYEGYLARQEQKKQEKPAEMPLFTVVDKGQSFSGDYIKNWCQHHLDANTEHAKAANTLLHEYWNEDGTNFTPNDRVFYFAKSSSFHGKATFRLVRDTEKSPKKVRYA